MCGNLTESEKTEDVFCSSCGAPITESKPEQKEEKLESGTSSSPVPTPPSTESRRTPTTQRPSIPQKETPDKSSTEKNLPPTEPPRLPDSSRQTEVPLDSINADMRIPTSSEESISSQAPSHPAPVSVDSSPQAMDVYEDKNLVVCPQCSYGCNPLWATCPICGTQIAGAENLQKITEAEFTINEESLKQSLIPCPKCGYSCDPAWEKCPICQTKLEKSE